MKGRKEEAQEAPFVFFQSGKDKRDDLVQYHRAREERAAEKRDAEGRGEVFGDFERLERSEPADRAGQQFHQWSGEDKPDDRGGEKRQRAEDNAAAKLAQVRPERGEKRIVCFRRPLQSSGSCFSGWSVGSDVDPVADRVVWSEYLEAVVRERRDWDDFYRACREVTA